MATPQQNRFSQNNFGVLGTKLDYSRADSPDTKTYHGIAIVMENSLIGRIQTWEPKMYSRKGEHIYELNSFTFGRPVDYVPGINEGYTVNCTKIEIWNQELEKALGYGDTAIWADLMDQTRPFTVTEYLYQGTNINRTWTYRGCWFTDRNTEGFKAQDTPTVKMNATLAFVSRSRGV
jgi:hypothetical protein